MFVLVATSVPDGILNGPPAEQTVRYFDTVAECQTYLIQVAPVIDPGFVQLSCRPIKANLSTFFEEPKWD